MRILVTGTRYSLGKHRVEQRLEGFQEANPDQHTLIQGGARGIDTYAQDVAEYFGWNLYTFPAEWDYYKWMGAVMRDEGMKKSAGPRRNEEMFETLRPDICFAFPATGSKGTWHMVRIVERALPVIPIVITHVGG